MRIKSVLLGAAAAASITSLAFAPSALADSGTDDGVDPSSYCQSEPVEGTQAGSGGSLTVCVAGVGAVDVSGDATGGGYVIADGDSTNPGAARGYIGVDSNEEGLLVGSACDTDQRDSGSAAVTVEGLANAGSPDCG